MANMASISSMSDMASPTVFEGNKGGNIILAYGKQPRERNYAAVSICYLQTP